MPPPSTLPRAVMSGVTPYRSCAPPAARRKPVITSSKMTSAPAARVAAASSRDTRGEARARRPNRARPRRSPPRGDPRLPRSPPRAQQHHSTAPSRASPSHRSGSGRVRARRTSSGRSADSRGEVIGPAVVVPFELDHELTPGSRPREPHSSLRRLGAGVRKSELLDPRHEVGDELGRLAGRAGAETRCATRRGRRSPRPLPTRMQARGRTG